MWQTSCSRWITSNHPPRQLCNKSGPRVVAELAELLFHIVSKTIYTFELFQFSHNEESSPDSTELPLLR